VPILIGVGAVLLLTGAILIATGVFSGKDDTNKNNKSAAAKPATADAGKAEPSTDSSPGGLSSLIQGRQCEQDETNESAKKETKPEEQEDKGPVPPEPDFARDKDRPFLVFDAQGHTALPRAALFTNDSKQVVTVAEDKTVRIWDVASGRPVRVLRLPAGTWKEGVPWAAALVPPGNRLAVAGISSGLGENGGQIHILDLKSGKIVQTFTGHERAITGLAVSRDGTGLASSSIDGTGIIHNLATGKSIVRMVHPKRKIVKAIACAADGLLLATASEDGIARVWNSKTLAIVELKGHAGEVNCVAFNNSTGENRMRLASGGADGTIRLWAPSGATRGLWKQTEDDGQTPVPITSLSFTKDGKELLYTTGGKNARAGLLNTETGKKRIEFKQHTNEGMAGARAPKGELALTSGGNDHESFLWRTKDGSVLHTL